MGPWLIPYSSKSLHSSSDDLELNEDMTVSTNHKKIVKKWITYI